MEKEDIYRLAAETLVTPQTITKWTKNQAVNAAIARQLKIACKKLGIRAPKPGISQPEEK